LEKTKPLLEITELGLVCRLPMVQHLYVHIPFCPKVCPYCSFYKEASDRNKTQAFLDAVLAEAEFEAEGLRPRTVFLAEARLRRFRRSN
jgi:coproporphyrinogen III oxidase-like Fe-S oxidoreductase